MGASGAVEKPVVSPCHLLFLQRPLHTEVRPCHDALEEGGWLTCQISTDLLATYKQEIATYLLSMAHICVIKCWRTRRLAETTTQQVLNSRSWNITHPNGPMLSAMKSTTARTQVDRLTVLDTSGYLLLRATFCHREKKTFKSRIRSSTMCKTYVKLSLILVLQITDTIQIFVTN